MRAAVPILCLLAATFAGCTGSSDGLSAMDAVQRADPEASAWAADAVLISVVGSETKGLNATLAESLGIGEEALGDATLADGLATAWYVSYYSPTTGKRLVLAILADGDIQTNADAPLDGFDGADAAKANRERWTVDSDEAIKALRASNTSVESAIDSATMANLLYGFSLTGVEWNVYVNTDSTRIQAKVDAQSGATGTVQVLGGSGLVPPPPPALPPAPIHKEGTIQASLDPLNLAMMPPCSTPTSSCDETPFTLNATFDIEATLSWTVPANDFDFYVMDANDVIVLIGASDVTMAGSTSEAISGSLDAGDYKLVVVPWNAAQDTFTLDATFA